MWTSWGIYWGSDIGMSVGQKVWVSEGELWKQVILHLSLFRWLHGKDCMNGAYSA